MKTDLLASRHIGINEQDTAVMLRKIGVNSLDELINQTNYIPHISVWDGTTRSLLPSFNGMYSKIRCGTPLILLIRRKYHRDVWKH